MKDQEEDIIIFFRPKKGIDASKLAMENKLSMREKDKVVQRALLSPREGSFVA